MHKNISLSGNALKIIAVIAMLVDHIGYMFFPKVQILRIIGRLALPIFAFMVAEGARHTKSKIKYILTLLIFAVASTPGYVLLKGKFQLCILFTFSISVAIIYTMSYVKKILFGNVSTVKKAVSVIAFLLLVICVYILPRYVSIEYGFFGCMLPVLVSACDFSKIDSVPKWIRRFDNRYVSLLLLAVGLIFLGGMKLRTQHYALLSIPILLLYSGQRGSANIKYFFYVFYPLHIIALILIYYVIRNFA